MNKNKTNKISSWATSRSYWIKHLLKLFMAGYIGICQNCTSEQNWTKTFLHEGSLLHGEHFWTSRQYCTRTFLHGEHFCTSDTFARRNFWTEGHFCTSDIFALRGHFCMGFVSEHGRIRNTWADTFHKGAIKTIKY